MPRKNSTTRSTGDDITATRLNDFNEDIDDLYSNGSDHLRVSEAISGTPLRIDISAGAYYIGSTVGMYAGGTDIVVTNSATNYVMIDNTGTITISTSARTAGLGRLATVVCSGGAITSITLWNNIVFGGAALDINALSASTIIEDGDQILLYKDSSGQNMKIDAMRRNVQDSFECAEAITIGDAVRMGIADITDVNVSGGSTESLNQGIGYSTTYSKQGQSFELSRTMKVKTVNISLRKSGSPASNLTMKIYSDQGTTLVATSTNTIAESSLSASAGGSIQTFSFTPVELTGGATYYFELSVPRANSTSHYSIMKVGSTYADGLAYRISSVNARTSHGSSAVFSVVADEETDAIYLGDESLGKTLGVAEQTKAVGEECTVTLLGISSSVSGLTPGALYGVSNSGNLSSSANNVIGKAISATQILLYGDTQSKVANGLFDRNSNQGTGTVVLPHGMERTPQSLSFFIQGVTTNNFLCFWASGSYAGRHNNNGTITNESSYLFRYTDSGGDTITWTVAVDETNITLTYTSVGTVTAGAYQVVWNASS